uniref:Uncharacterized protein n=1 Tax=viral metagenome TaxID=1070528 RepID=A0A6C0LLI2_9ZZZZ|tara:strand:+ start:214 stop:342 length:129 start_codon:yes stop_codon:yes gene_type:complete
MLACLCGCTEPDKTVMTEPPPLLKGIPLKDDNDNDGFIVIKK